MLLTIIRVVSFLLNHNVMEFCFKLGQVILKRVPTVGQFFVVTSRKLYLFLLLYH